jgi:hypothetical protein
LRGLQILSFCFSVTRKKNIAYNRGSKLSSDGRAAIEQLSVVGSNPTLTLIIESEVLKSMRNHEVVRVSYITHRFDSDKPNFLFLFLSTRQKNIAYNRGECKLVN